MPDSPKNGNGNHLSHAFFEKLSKMLPGMKAKKLELKQKAFVGNVERKAHEKMPCPICGVMFDPFNGLFQKKHEHCEKCRKNLEDGYTALVTLDGKRFSFTKFPQATPEQASSVAGKIMRVTNGQMDVLEKNKAAEN